MQKQLPLLWEPAEINMQTNFIFNLYFIFITYGASCVDDFKNKLQLKLD